MAETSWRRSPMTATGGEGSCSTISMPRWSAVARTRSMASAMTRLTSTGSRGGASSDSIRERSSRSSMMRLTRKASLWMRPARRWATSGSGSATRVSASRPEGAHRGLELVAHVGDEVAADLLEAPPLRDVLDHGDDAQRPPAVVDLAGPHLQGAPGRAVEVERALGRALVPGVLQQLGHRLGGQGVAVAADHQGVGPAVAVDHAAVLVAEHDALGERVERAPQPDGVRAGLGHGLGGAAGDLLEVGQRGLDVVLVLGRVQPEPGPERGEALGDGPAPGPASEVGRDQSHQHREQHRARDEDDLLGLAQIDFPRPAQRHVPNMTGLKRARRPPAAGRAAAAASGRGSDPKRGALSPVGEPFSGRAASGGPGAGSHHGGHRCSCTWPMSR